MKNILLLCSLGIILLSCSSEPKKAVDPNCIPDKAIQEILKSSEPLIDSMSQVQADATLKTVLSDESCFKRSYIRGAYKILMFRDPNDKRHTVLASVKVAKKFEIDADQCLVRALSDLKILDSSFTDKIIKLHQDRYQWLWNDADIGPVNWLTCTKEKDVNYYDSLAVFIHELNHEIREEECMVSAIDQEKLCFKLDKNLPNRSIAKIDKIPAKDKDDEESLARIQTLYLSATDQPPYLLFDELNSYILTTKIQSALLTKFGKETLVGKSGKRARTYLPLLELFSVRYLNQLKLKNPKLYAEYFSSNGENYKNLNKLFIESERTYQDLKVAFKANDISLVDFEKDLHDQYIKLKQKL